MTRRPSRAGRDAGSTTGVATAVLALLSAGSLAALGLVTASEVRDGAGPPAPQAGPARVAPPLAVVVTPTPPPAPPERRSDRPAGPLVPVEPLPEVVPPTVTAPEPPGPVFTGAPSAPQVPEAPAGPVFTAVSPAPAPSPATSVLPAKSPRKPTSRSEHPGKRARVRADHPVYATYGPSALAKAAERSAGAPARPAKAAKPAKSQRDTARTARPQHVPPTVPVLVPTQDAVLGSGRPGQGSEHGFGHQTDRSHGLG